MKLKIKMNINDNFHNCPQASLQSLFFIISDKKIQVITIFIYMR